jgi:hypothetical protein
MFGITEQFPSWIGIVVIPIFAWEITLAIWLITKGFKSSAISAEPVQPAANDLLGAT